MAWLYTDEDKVQALAVAWRVASLAFTPVRVEPNDIRYAWRDKADQASVQLGIDLAHEYGPGALTPEAVTKALLDRRDSFEQAGAIRPL